MYINTAVSEEERLRSKVDQLHQHERMEVLPRLHAQLEECQDVRAYAKDQLMRDFAHHRDMPAMQLLPHRTCESHSCLPSGIAVACLSSCLLCMLGQISQPHPANLACLLMRLDHADAVPEGFCGFITSNRTPESHRIFHLSSSSEYGTLIS